MTKERVRGSLLEARGAVEKINWTTFIPKAVNC
jgi:hypothetical protein